jgi:hypothetical protein
MCDPGMPTKQGYLTKLVQQRTGGGIDRVIMEIHRQYLPIALLNILEYRRVTAYEFLEEEWPRKLYLVRVCAEFAPVRIAPHHDGCNNVAGSRSVIIEYAQYIASFDAQSDLLLKLS